MPPLKDKLGNNSNIQLPYNIQRQFTQHLEMMSKSLVSSYELRGKVFLTPN